jgi:hypothetical protein
MEFVQSVPSYMHVFHFSPSLSAMSICCDDPTRTALYIFTYFAFIVFKFLI